MLGIDISARYWPTVHTAAVLSSPNNLSFNGSPSHVLMRPSVCPHWLCGPGVRRPDDECLSILHRR